MREIQPVLQHPPELLLKAQGIRWVIFDVDGVLTDGRLYFDADGEVIKVFSSLDGHGLKLLARHGIVPTVITGRDSPGRAPTHGRAWRCARHLWRHRQAGRSAGTDQQAWFVLGVTRCHGAMTGPICRCSCVRLLPVRRPMRTWRSRPLLITSRKPEAVKVQRASVATCSCLQRAVMPTRCKVIAPRLTRTMGENGDDTTTPLAAPIRASGDDEPTRGMQAGQVPLPEPPASSSSTTTSGLTASPWYWRLIDLLSNYLPLVLMAFLALGTWWLVKNTPVLNDNRPEAPPRHEPDYTMSRFLVQRFGADGALRVQIEGDALRHYPDDDTFEIDNPSIRAIDATGRVSTATGTLALSNHNGSDVQLKEGAHVVREATADDPAIDFRGEFLHYSQYSQRVESHLPVLITQGTSQLKAQAMVYDNAKQVLDLKGHVEADLTPETLRPKAGRP